MFRLQWDIFLRRENSYFHFSFASIWGFVFTAGISDVIRGNHCKIFQISHGGKNITKLKRFSFYSNRS